jgi:alpha-beta hydrolase superfamily lysophospholipase
MNMHAPPSPLDFAAFTARLKAQGESACVPVLRRVPAEDGIQLAYRLFLPAARCRHVLAFYHGGGACMEAGYACLASAICRTAAAAVALVDIRGHGESGGARGHTATVETAYRDIDRLLMTLQQQFPGAELDLGGHSSGAGLALNYMTQFRRRAAVRRLLLVAPEFGRQAGTQRNLPDDGKPAFATVRAWPFIVNLLSGGRLCGATPAVRLSFAGLDAELRHMMVETYTVNMALAVTPVRPVQQLAGLDLPTTILAGRQDELNLPEGVAGLVARAANRHVTLQMLERTTHLEILLDAHEAIVAALDYPPPIEWRRAAP